MLPLKEMTVEIGTAAVLADSLLVLYWSDGAGEHIETRDGSGRRLSWRRPDFRDVLPPDG